MKSLVNLILIFSVGYAAYLLMPFFHGWFGGLFMLGTNVETYWGWFDWLTILDWIPRLLMGFVCGLVVAIFCQGDKPHLWALACGILMMIAAYLTTAGSWSIAIPPSQKIFQSLWPVMYPLGTFLGGVFVVIVRDRIKESKYS